jgi:hypothetical protein
MATEPVNRSTRTDNGAMKDQPVVLRITEAKRQAIKLAEWHTGTNRKGDLRVLWKLATRSKRLSL